MLKKVTLVTVICAAFGVAFAAVTGDDFTLSLVNSDTHTVTVTAEFRVETGADGRQGVQGWSWGVCHDPPDGASIGDCAGVPQPSTPCDGTGCPNYSCPQDMIEPVPGRGIDFHSLNIYEGGITQGVVLSFTMQYTLGTGQSPFEMLNITYDVPGAPVDVNFCNTLGTPAVDITVVVGGQSYTPPPANLIGTRVPDIVQPGLALHLQEEAPAVNVLLDTGDGDEVSGFQFGVTQSQASIRISGISQGQALLDVAGAGGAEFFGANIIDAQSATLGVVLTLNPGDPPNFLTLPANTADQEVAVIAFTNPTDADVTASVALSGDLGTPPVAIVVDVDGTSREPEVGDPVSVTVPGGGVVEADFVRGDANQDGSLNVSDAVAIAKAVFGLGSKLPLIEACMDSADVNDDGAMNTADAVYLLDYLFMEGAAIPAPNTCGQDPTTGDTLGCTEFACP